MEWRPDLWAQMLERTYSGHVDLARKLFDICWQADWEGKDVAANKFWEAVATSPHGRALVEAQGYEIPKPEPEPDPNVKPESTATQHKDGPTAPRCTDLDRYGMKR